jgi:hypothetical protein
MPADDYATIRGFTVDKKAMSAKYKGEDRKLWPFVIGESPKPHSPTQKEKVVLCYQIATPTSSAGWRCFKVTSLKNPSEISATGRPPELTERELERQSCVQDRDYPPPHP